MYNMNVFLVFDRIIKNDKTSLLSENGFFHNYSLKVKSINLIEKIIA